MPSAAPNIQFSLSFRLPIRLEKSSVATPIAAEIPKTITVKEALCPDGITSSCDSLTEESVTPIARKRMIGARNAEIPLVDLSFL